MSIKMKIAYGLCAIKNLCKSRNYQKNFKTLRQKNSACIIQGKILCNKNTILKI